MASIREIMDEWDIFDQAIIRHGFTDYNRDYLMQVVYCGSDHIEHPATFLFRGCVESHYQNVVVPGAYPTFMDDRFINYQTWEEAGCPDGFVWGVNYADAYPGWRYIKSSEQAALWSRKLGLPMHEMVIETNTYSLTLVFHDLVVQGGESGAGSVQRTQP